MAPTRHLFRSGWAHCLHVSPGWLCGPLKTASPRAWERACALCRWDVLWLPSSVHKAAGSGALWVNYVQQVCSTLCIKSTNLSSTVKAQTRKKIKSQNPRQQDKWNHPSRSNLFIWSKIRAFYPESGGGAVEATVSSRDTCGSSWSHSRASRIVLPSFVVNFLSYLVISPGSLRLALLFS